MQEMWVWSLGQEDPLEKEVSTHSSILAWRIAWMEEPGGLESVGSQRVGHDWVTKHQQQHDQEEKNEEWLLRGMMFLLWVMNIL